MNPLLSQFLSSILRWLLTGLGAWFVQKGILDESQVTEMIAGAIIALLALGWSLWSKYKSKVELFTVAAMPKGTTLEEAKQSIASGVQASATTAADETPRLQIQVSKGDSRPAAWLLPLLLAGSIGVSACALGRGTIDTNPPPTQEQIQQVRNEAAKLASATKEAATLAVQARRIAQQAYDSGAISRDVMQKVNDAAIVTSQKGVAFVAFAETVTTDPSLRVTATELFKVFDDFIASLKNAGQTGQAIRAALAAFRAYLGVQ